MKTRLHINEGANCGYRLHVGLGCSRIGICQRTGLMRKYGFRTNVVFGRHSSSI